MMNSNEERFFASESLAGILSPNLLEEPKTPTGNFSLIVKDENYSLQTYSENGSNISITFVCNDNMLFNILALDNKEISLQCGDNKLSRDLAGYETSWNIIKVDNETYEVSLAFTKNQTGLING